MVPPGSDGELHDTVLEQEIELLADLIDAVAKAGHPLCQSEVDHALGVSVDAGLAPTHAADARTAGVLS
jgi:hypothetical protein